jgi:integral membrane sensor domain MASE1
MLETKESQMTIGAALVVVLAGVLIAAFLNATIGVIVAAIGVVGLIIALFSTTRSRGVGV